MNTYTCRTDFPWFGCKEGVSHEVLPPWTPLTVTQKTQGDFEINCWGRRYNVAAGPFPERVETAGKSVLASPVQLHGVADGQSLVWQTENARVVEETPARVTIATQLSAAHLLLSATTGVEYDGMIRVDLRLTSRASVILEQLVLEIAFHSEHARYLYHFPGRWGSSYNACSLPDTGLVADFRPFIWLGDEERGLCWFCESDENWFPADPHRTVEIMPQGSSVVLQLNLVGIPVRIGTEGGQVAELAFTFGFQATPVRPNDEDVWDLRLCHGAEYGCESLRRDAPCTLRYPAEGNINLLEGTVELYVQPLFDTMSPAREQDLFTLQLPRGDEVRWFWPEQGKGMQLLVRQQQDRVVELTTRPVWQKGKMHHVALTWGDSVRVYHDGQLLAQAPRRGLFVGSLEGGVIVFGGPGAHLLLDDIRISSIPRSQEELCHSAAASQPLGLDDDTLLLDHLDLSLEPGIIEHLDGGYSGYASTEPTRASGDWGWRGKPGGIIGLGRFREGRFGNGLELGLDKPPLDYFAELGVRTLCIHEQWTDWEGYPATTHAEKLCSLVRACHDRGIRLLVYLGFLLSDLAPEWPVIGAECVAEPRHAYNPYDYPPQPHQVAYTVCYRSIWQDALAHGIARLMDEFDVDGVYLDGTANPPCCENRLHGCGYTKPDGSIGATYPIFATRDMMRRIYTIVKTRKPYGQVNVHQSTCMTIPSLAWATSYWDGEQFGSIESGRFALETISLDAFRTEFMGHQWGVPAEFLCYDRPYKYEEALAFTLLHDVLVRANGLGPHLELESRLWKLADAFQRKEARWLPYWRNGEFVHAEPDGIYVSLYHHSRNGVLAVVGNLSYNEQLARVTFDLARLGLSQTATAKDGIENSPVEMVNGCIQFLLPSLQWRIIWLV